MYIIRGITHPDNDKLDIDTYCRLLVDVFQHLFTAYKDLERRCMETKVHSDNSENSNNSANSDNSCDDMGF